jgi:hypothetical protein
LEDTAMAYMLLVVEPRGQREACTKEEGATRAARMQEFAGGLFSRGVLLSADSFAPDEKATQVQVRDGEPRFLAGPFTDSSKEMVGGYFHLDVETEDDAVAIAKDCPAAEWATIEVRGTIASCA